MLKSVFENLNFRKASDLSLSKNEEDITVLELENELAQISQQNEKLDKKNAILRNKLEKSVHQHNELGKKIERKRTKNIQKMIDSFQSKSKSKVQTNDADFSTKGGSLKNLFVGAKNKVNIKYKRNFDLTLLS